MFFTPLTPAPVPGIRVPHLLPLINGMINGGVGARDGYLFENFHKKSAIMMLNLFLDIFHLIGLGFQSRSFGMSDRTIYAWASVNRRVENFLILKQFGFPHGFYFSYRSLTAHAWIRIGIDLIYGSNSRNGRVFIRERGFNPVLFPNPGQAGNLGEIKLNRDSQPMDPVEASWLTKKIIRITIDLSVGYLLGVKPKYLIIVYSINQLENFVFSKLPSVLNRGHPQAIIFNFQKVYFLGHLLSALGSPELNPIANSNTLLKWETFSRMTQLAMRTAVAIAGYDRYFSREWQVFSDTQDESFTFIERE